MSERCASKRWESAKNAAFIQSAVPSGENSWPRGGCFPNRPKKPSQNARIAGVSRWLKWRDIKEAARAAAKPIMSKGAREARLRLDTKSNGGTRG